MTRLTPVLLLAFAFLVPAARAADEVSLLSADGARIEITQEVAQPEQVSPADQIVPIPQEQAHSYPELVICKCKPSIDYSYHRSMGRFKCSKTIETILLVKNPYDCCYVEVPICMPVCCEGEPKTWCKSALLGREMVVYQWCCGFRAVVLFRPNGSVTVHYHGD